MDSLKLTTGELLVSSDFVHVSFPCSRMLATASSNSLGNGRVRIVNRTVEANCATHTARAEARPVTLSWRRALVRYSPDEIEMTFCWIEPVALLRRSS